MISTELQRIIQAKADIVTSIENKGVTVPAGTKIDDLDDYVDQIEQGGGGDTKEKWSEGEMFTITALGNVELKTKKLSTTNYVIPLWYKINNNDWVKFFPFTKNEQLTINLVANDTLKFYYEDDGNMYDALNVMIQNTNNWYFPKLYLNSGDINVSGYVDALVGPYKTDKAYYFGAITSGYSNSDGILNAIDASGLLFIHQNDYTDSRYQMLFSGWSKLTTPPALPTSDRLGYKAYYCMFQSCSGLTGTVTINAQYVSSYGINQMYAGCTNITAANINIREWEPGSSYVAQNTFANCTSLTTVHLGMCILTEDSWAMFYGCTALTDVYFDNLYYIRNASNINNMQIDSNCNIYLYSLASNSGFSFTNTNIFYGVVIDPSSNVHGNCDFYLESLENDNVLHYVNNSGGSFANIKYYDGTTNTWVSWDPANTITLNEHEKLYLHAFSTSNNNHLCSIWSSKQIKAAGAIQHLAGSNGVIVDIRHNTKLVDITDVLFISTANTTYSSIDLPDLSETGISQLPPRANFTGIWSLSNLCFIDNLNLSGTLDTYNLYRGARVNNPFRGTNIDKLIVETTSRISYPPFTSGVILYKTLSNYDKSIIDFFNNDSIYSYFGKIRIKLNEETVEIPFDNVNNCYKANLTIKTGDVLGILHDIGNTTTKIVINNTEYPCTYGQLNYYTMTNNYSTISINYNSNKTTTFGNWYVITLS